MEIIWEKADYLLRLLFCIVFGIACILIVIAPLYASHHKQSGQESKDAPKKGGQEYANEDDNRIT
ncbi:hypothetical protein J8K92_06370 [Bacteroides fragilis]|uniref:hypothetical protein n=1 Tax=Bacteroides fragilis TaxID=817 RepID=UPI00202E8D25|nr:hypothetical protein [Bacteroides fragilis]MCM0298266.1 hypothetical protein [Bacteroides fragilis]